MTWEPSHPRGCKAYGFKTRELPSAVVLRSSGLECMKFEPKKGSGGA
ncbi:uracil-DNA glycosylase [Sporosarcina aquimarina]